MVAVLYLLFFLSGAAALVYEIAWVRSLSLVFGASHLAVSTVLAVFMGGLALGSVLLAKRADASHRPLRLYGLLELGIAAGALAFLGLTRVYPAVYVPLARLGLDSGAWLTAIRIGFAVAAMIVPTTLMGGTLPVMTRFLTARRGSLARHLSFLYGFNTLGAMAGCLVAGFVLLRGLGVTRSVLVAVSANLLVGLLAVLLPESAFGRTDRTVREEARPQPRGSAPDLAFRLVLVGIGVSGFCALGYEILWTRMLSLVVGTSVYSFTIMLVAFLCGIGLGSEALGLVLKRRGGAAAPRRLIAGFGVVQVLIGLSALAVTVLLRDLPTHAMSLQSWLVRASGTEFAARQGASFGVAFLYMLVPAVFMGVAFPLAGTIYAAWRGRVAGAVGQVLFHNTVGAILGAAGTGFLLIYALGIERSLQVLVTVNMGLGLTVLGVLAAPRSLGRLAPAVASLVLVALVVDPSWGRLWDRRYFAIFRNNQRDAFDTEFRRQDALENTEVLYYHEGVNETISVIRPRGGHQAFLVNGRPEATTSPMDVQCQRTLGHLPMLLHPDPKRVFVLGTGTGMTLGATSIHPEVERIVLAEIEPGVIPAARTFGAWNHRALDNPKLEVVLSDGRNYLATTRERFDVITADPIHPWSGGAAYLYTSEYFASVAAHLRPGGIACQWLPIYALRVHDVQSVLRTFAGEFAHVLVWLTHYDAQIVGSQQPLLIDEEAIERRLGRAGIREDLAVVEMGSAEDLLSYFVTGEEGARAFGAGGRTNTDDNLFLEFSAPESIGVGHLMGKNVMALARHRGSLLPYLLRPASPERRREQEARWARNLEAARLYDSLHALYLWNEAGTAPFAVLRARLESLHPGYGPWRFLKRELAAGEAATPRLVAADRFPVLTAEGSSRILEVSAVGMRVGETRAALVLVDNQRREIYGQQYLDGEGSRLDAEVGLAASRLLERLRASYAECASRARARGLPSPGEAEVDEAFRGAIEQAVAGGEGS